jgi:ribonuclease HI
MEGVYETTPKKTHGRTVTRSQEIAWPMKSSPLPTKERSVDMKATKPFVSTAVEKKMEQQIVCVYTDGSADLEQREMSWGMVIANETHEKANGKLRRLTMVSSTLAEMAAIAQAMTVVATNVPICIYSDSQSSLDLIKRCVNGEFRSMRELTRTAAWVFLVQIKYIYDRRKATTECLEFERKIEKEEGKKIFTQFKKVKAHAGNVWNEEADALAEAARNEKCGYYNVIPGMWYSYQISESKKHGTVNDSRDAEMIPGDMIKHVNKKYQDAARERLASAHGVTETCLKNLVKDMNKLKPVAQPSNHWSVGRNSEDTIRHSP